MVFGIVGFEYVEVFFFKVRIFVGIDCIECVYEFVVEGIGIDVEG